MKLLELEDDFLKINYSPIYSAHHLHVMGHSKHKRIKQNKLVLWRALEHNDDDDDDDGDERGRED